MVWSANFQLSESQPRIQVRHLDAQAAAPRGNLLCVLLSGCLRGPHVMRMYSLMPISACIENEVSRMCWWELSRYTRVVTLSVLTLLPPIGLTLEHMHL